MERNVYLSVILPAYNEESLTENTLTDVYNYLKGQNYSFEIIAINDGSSDKTEDVLLNLKSKIGDLKIISNEINRGKGFSVRRGMLQAQGKYRLFMDADNSTNINEIGKFLEAMKNGIDAAIGDRTLSSSIIAVHQPAYKKILGTLGNMAIRTLAVPGIKDTQCGFKCFSEKLVKDVFPELKIDRWAFDVEILALSRKRGYEIKTIPIVWKNRHKSNVKIMDYILTLLDLLKIKINLISNKYERAK